MVVRCTIKFDNNPNGIYFAGQILTGKIIFQSDKPKKVKGVQLKIKGFAHTEWSEQSSTTTSTGNGQTTTTTVSTTYSGHIDYINTKIQLINNATEIEPGTHVYNFSCRIPDICPTSFECTYGHIRYMVKVVLIRPWKFNQSYTRGFTVLNIVNLNYGGPYLRSPIYRNLTRVFGVWPFRSAPMLVNVNLPQSGYVPGQSIPVSVLITNESNIKFKSIKAELVMHVHCHSQRPSRHTKHKRTVLHKCKGELTVLPQSKKLFAYKLSVPPTPPTCVNMCSIIQISYEVEVHIEVSGLHRDTKVSVPVTIGSVPLVGAIAQQPTLPSGGAIMRAVPQAPAASTAALTETSAAVDKAVEAAEINLQAEPVPTDNTDELPKYSGATAGNYPWLEGFDMPPPSYETAVHVPHAKINEDEKHDFGESDFVPRYPRYNIASPMAPTVEEIETGAAAVETKKANKK